MRPSGVGVALARGVAVARVGEGDGDGDVVTDAGRVPAVLTTEPSGANSSDPAAPLTPRTTGLSDGGATGAGVGVGAVPKTMVIGAVAEAPDTERIAV